MVTTDTKTLQVTCINKRGNHYDPHERIAAIGGGGGLYRWKHQEADAIRYIESGTYRYYVSVGGHSVWVVVATHKGRKYLKTQNDGYRPDNLLALAECP
jgi:Protein of unknown function (DUF3892)